MGAAEPNKGRRKMDTFYRVQPAGLGLDHHSASSRDIAEDTETPGVDVFLSAWQVWNTDGFLADYGDEVIEIEAPKSWDNGDVEGVRVEPSQARITRRWSLDEYARAFGFDDAEDAVDRFREVCDDWGIDWEEMA